MTDSYFEVKNGTRKENDTEENEYVLSNIPMKNKGFFVIQSHFHGLKETSPFLYSVSLPTIISYLLLGVSPSLPLKGHFFYR